MGLDVCVPQDLGKTMGEDDAAAIAKVRRGLATLERLGFISRRPAGTPATAPERI